MMTIRFAFLLVLSLALSGFVALNWTAFITPTTLLLGFSTVQAPLGLVMLGVLLLVASLFALYVLYLHAAEVLLTRRLLKDMEAQRKLVDQAEASRFTELRSLMDEQFNLQKQRDAETLASVQAKNVSGTQADRVFMEEITNGLSAQLGQLEDRLDRLLPALGAPQL
jgi:hypothetical protein